MSQVKTKIWRGGLAGAALPAGASTAAQAPREQPRADAQITAPALSQTRVVAPAAHAGSPAESLASARSAASLEVSPLPTVIRPAPSLTSSTRIMPVEALLAPRLEAETPSAPEEPVVLPRNPPGMRLLIAGLLACTLGIWVVPRLFDSRQAHTPAPLVPRVQPVQASEPSVSATPRAATLPAAPRSTPAPRAESEPRGRPQQRSDQRCAADALARGDSSLAATLYARLAAAHPEQPAYAQAARILDRRLASGR